jgi:hypothetical protein
MPPRPPDYRQAFPQLTDDNHEKKSEFDPRYNCIGFAAGTKLWWWPKRIPGMNRYWPPGVPQEVTIEAFVKAFEFKGYAVCSDGALEEGFEKIALFGKGDEPKHAARQIDKRYWASKLGGNIDIHHELKAVEGDQYGQIIRYMKRAKPQT